MCQEYFGDTWVLDGDIFLNKNFLRADISTSTYFSGKKQILQPEWELRFNEKNILQDIIIHDNLLESKKKEIPVHVMSGISYWSQTSSPIILSALNHKIPLILNHSRSDIGNQYWDQLIIDNLDKLDISIQPIDSNDWIEIDCEYDLPSVESSNQPM